VGDQAGLCWEHWAAGKSKDGAQRCQRRTQPQLSTSQLGISKAKQKKRKQITKRKEKKQENPSKNTSFNPFSRFARVAAVK